MEQRTDSPGTTALPWFKIALALLPGLWHIALQRFGFSYTLADGGMVLLIAGSVAVSLLLEHRLAAWCLPALGIFAWRCGFWLLELVALLPMSSAFLQTLPTFLAWALLVLLCGYGAYRAVRATRFRPSPVAWGIFVLFLIATLGLSFYLLAQNSPTDPLIVTLPGVFLKTLLLLAPVAGGLWIARCEGLRAALFVVGYTFVWSLSAIDPAYNVVLWAPPRYDWLKPLIVWLPTVCFMLITPLWMLLARKHWLQAAGLLLPPVLALLGGQAIAADTLRSTTLAFTPQIWFNVLTLGAQYLLPLALAAALYGDIEPTTQP